MKKTQEEEEEENTTTNNNSNNNKHTHTHTHTNFLQIITKTYSDRKTKYINIQDYSHTQNK